MNEASPVKNATASSTPAAPVSASRRGGTEAAAIGRAISHTQDASTRLIAPANRSVPGNPAHSMRTNPLTSTPAAAPRLLVK